MTPNPGGVLDQINNLLADPSLALYARLAKAPTGDDASAVTLADLTECDFAGYAPVKLVAGLDLAVDEAEYGEMSPVRVRFETGAIVAPQIVTFLYVTKQVTGTAAKIAMAVAFPRPLVLNKAGQIVEFDINLAGILLPD